MLFEAERCQISSELTGYAIRGQTKALLLPHKEMHFYEERINAAHVLERMLKIVPEVLFRLNVPLKGIKLGLFFVVVEYLERSIHNIAWSLLRCRLRCKGKSPVPVRAASAVIFGRYVVYIVTVRSAIAKTLSRVCIGGSETKKLNKAESLCSERSRV